MILDISENQILGAGGFGIVISTAKDFTNRNPNYEFSLKLIKEINECEKIKSEVIIHNKIEKVLQDTSPNEEYPPAKVPHIYEEYNKNLIVKYNNIEKEYLCGILMDKIEPLYNGLQFHLAFGCELDNDINQIHYTKDNEPRGFYGGVDYLIILIETNDEMVKNFPSIAFENPEKYIETLVIRMAKTYKYLYDAKIVPFDIEFVLDKYGEIWCLDFGLCYEVDEVNKNCHKEIETSEYIPCYKYLRDIFNSHFKI